MKIDVQKFLAVSAILAAGAANACSDTASNGDGDGDGDDTGDGDGDGTGGLAGDGDGDGDGDGTGGMKANGTGGMDGGAGGMEALGGFGGTPDECIPGDSVDEISCADAFTDCTDEIYSFGDYVCDQLSYSLSPAALSGLIDCLSEVRDPTEVDGMDGACAQEPEAHTTGVLDCVDALLTTGAESMCTTDLAVELCGELLCTEISEAECQAALSLLPDSVAEGSDAAAVMANCDGDYTGCGFALTHCIDPTVE